MTNDIDPDLLRAEFMRNLATDLVHMMIKTTKQHEAMVEISLLDCVICCGAAVKAIGVMATQVHPALTEDNAMRDLRKAIEFGLSIPSDFIADVTKDIDKNTPQH